MTKQQRDLPVRDESMFLIKSMLEDKTYILSDDFIDELILIFSKQDSEDTYIADVIEKNIILKS